MDTQHQAYRPEASRSNTWPSQTTPILKFTHSKVSQKAELDLFDLDEHPEEHFLSPGDMYDYDDDWFSDSEDEDDADEVEWNAGITDFALFDRERRQAHAAGRAVPERWGSLLSNQASAFDRSVERSRSEDLPRSSSTESMPDLTPDTSPHLRDDLEIGSYRPTARSVVPAYLRSTTSPSITIRPTEDDAELLTFYVQPRRTQSSPHIKQLKPVRPGLRDGRTLSGKQHVWRRPSWDIFTVREDPVAETKAEACGTVPEECNQSAISDFQLALIR